MRKNVCLQLAFPVRFVVPITLQCKACLTGSLQFNIIFYTYLYVPTYYLSAKPLAYLPTL